jgi:hypothetical protein
VVGSVWLTLTAVIAFIVAAWNAGLAEAPARQGALNAICAYLLVLPLVLIVTSHPSVVQISATAAVALAVGAAAGWARTRYGAAAPGTGDTTVRGRTARR